MPLRLVSKQKYKNTKIQNTFPVSSSLVHLEVAGSGLRDLEEDLEEDLEDLEEDQQIRSYLDAFCLWQRKRRMVIASKYS